MIYFYSILYLGILGTSVYWAISAIRDVDTSTDISTQTFHQDYLKSIGTQTTPQIKKNQLYYDSKDFYFI